MLVGHQRLACAMGGHTDVGGVGEGDMDTVVCIVGGVVSMAFSYAYGVEVSMCPLVDAVVYCFVAWFWGVDWFG